MINKRDVDFDYIIERLPPSSRHRVWTTGEGIMCVTEEAAESIADLLRDVFNLDVVTGYHDPEEDERGCCVDESTGFYCVSTNG